MRRPRIETWYRFCCYSVCCAFCRTTLFLLFLIAMLSAQLSFRFAEPDTSAVAEADCYLSRLAQSVPVDAMPGPEDPSNFMLPQQPFVPCLVRRAIDMIPNALLSRGFIFTLKHCAFPLAAIAFYLTFILYFVCVWLFCVCMYVSGVQFRVPRTGPHFRASPIRTTAASRA